MRPLVLGCEQALHFSCSANVASGRLHQLEDAESLRQLIPLHGAARGVADLEVADAGSCEVTNIRLRTEERSY